MNVKLTQPQRLLVALIYLVILTVIFMFLGGSLDSLTLKGGSDRSLWFYAGILLVVLGRYVAEPFFTKPTDSLANALAALIALTSLSSRDELYGYAFLIAFTLTVLIATLLSIGFKDSKNDTRRFISKNCYWLSTKLGSSKVLFSAVFLASIYSYLAIGSSPDLTGFVILIAFWICIVFFDVIGKIVETISSIKHVNPIDVFFDDFTVTQNHTRVVQAQNFYPGGAIFGSYEREAITPQKHFYQGKEWQTDLGYNMYDIEWRQFDPYLWVTPTPDPHADNYLDVSPYSWVNNNPINLIDPDGRDWYDINGKVKWRNKEGDYTNKKGKEFKSLGKNVLVVTHNRDKKGKEEVNSATFSLYLESDKSGATATLKGNTVPSDTESYGTLAEGIYPARLQARDSKPGENAIIVNEGGELPTVNGNPNKENSDKLTGVFFHRGNPYQKSLLDSNGDAVWSHGCLLGGCGPGSLDKFNSFMDNAKDFNGKLYLRAKPKVSTPVRTRYTTQTHQWVRTGVGLKLVPKTK